jgi:hypothetical protein
MTREEQIKEQAKKQMRLYESPIINDKRRIGFISGAKWADKHPVSPWVPLDGNHKKPLFGRIILVFYPLGDGVVDLVKRSKIRYGTNVNGNYPNGIDEYGLPVLSPNPRAKELGIYNIRATLYMDIPEPIK